MVKVRTNISGNRYGRLTVISQSEEDLIKSNGKKEALWLCKCDCGNMTKLPKYKLDENRQIVIDEVIEQETKEPIMEDEENSNE